MQPAHPLGVARGQVVVDGDHVHAVAGQGVQVDRAGSTPGSCPRRSSSRRSSRSGAPCRPSAGRRSGAGRAPASAASRTRAKASTSRSSRVSPLSSRSRNSAVRAELVVGAGLDLRLEVVDQRDQLGQAADLLPLAGSEDLREHAHGGPTLPSAASPGGLRSGPRPAAGGPGRPPSGNAGPGRPGAQAVRTLRKRVSVGASPVAWLRSPDDAALGPLDLVLELFHHQ